MTNRGRRNAPVLPSIMSQAEQTALQDKLRHMMLPLVGHFGWQDRREFCGLAGDVHPLFLPWQLPNEGEHHVTRFDAPFPWLSGKVIVV